MRYGPYQGRRPASMWQWPQLPDILRRAGMLTCVFHQGNLGAGYPKPTRLLLRTRLQLPSFCFVGPPTFDSNGFYKGPLPLAKGMGSIRSQHTSGPFKTSGTECWPARMCQWIAGSRLLRLLRWRPLRLPRRAQNETPLACIRCANQRALDSWGGGPPQEL